MRLWHKDLISVLPKQQLAGQWRECCLIAKAISENGTPNHLLVNKVLDYPDVEFTIYGKMVYLELCKRGYKCDWNRFMQYRRPSIIEIGVKNLFKNWHNDRYLRQCLYNLQEKYDCGGISEKEWNIICYSFPNIDICQEKILKNPPFLTIFCELNGGYPK